MCVGVVVRGCCSASLTLRFSLSLICSEVVWTEPAWGSTTSDSGDAEPDGAFEDAVGLSRRGRSDDAQALAERTGAVSREDDDDEERQEDQAQPRAARRRWPFSARSSHIGSDREEESDGDSAPPAAGSWEEIRRRRSRDGGTGVHPR